MAPPSGPSRRLANKIWGLQSWAWRGKEARRLNCNQLLCYMLLLLLLPPPLLFNNRFGEIFASSARQKPPKLPEFHLIQPRARSSTRRKFITSLSLPQMSSSLRHLTSEQDFDYLLAIACGARRPRPQPAESLRTCKDAAPFVYPSRISDLESQILNPRVSFSGLEPSEMLGEPRRQVSIHADQLTQRTIRRGLGLCTMAHSHRERL